VGRLHAASLSDALAFQLWPLRVGRGGAMLPWDDSSGSRVGAGTRTACFHSRDFKLDCSRTGTGAGSCSDIEGNLKLDFWLKLQVMLIEGSGGCQWPRWGQGRCGHCQGTH
jgi:hypothetical protein